MKRSSFKFGKTSRRNLTKQNSSTKNRVKTVAIIQERQVSETSSSSLSENQETIIYDVFKMPPVRMPSILDEIFDSKSPEKQRKLENRKYSQEDASDVTSDSKTAENAIDPRQRSPQEQCAEMNAKALLVQKFRHASVPGDISGKGQQSLTFGEKLQQIQASQRSSIVRCDSVTHSEEAQEEMLNRVHREFSHRFSSGSNSANENSPAALADLEISIAGIFLKSVRERSQQEIEMIHHFMIRHVKMFATRTRAVDGQRHAAKKQRLSLEDNIKHYQAMQTKVFAQSDKIVEYGSTGDRFYIIVEGQVSVLQPSDTEMRFNTCWDIFQFVVREFERITIFRDEVSKEVGLVVALIGAPLLRSLQFARVTDLVDFLRQVDAAHSDLLQVYPKLDSKKLFAKGQKIKTLIGRLKRTSELTFADQDATKSRQASRDQQFIVRLQLMEQVNILGAGQTFGADSLTSDDCKRNATCVALSKRVVVATLTKTDYQRVYAEQERVKTEQKIAAINEFGLFKSVSKRKMKHYYRLFYDPKTLGCYEKLQNQFVFHQGEPVDGIYFLLSGQVKLIKETWTFDDTDCKITGEIKNDSQVNDQSQSTGQTDQLKPIGLVNELKRNQAKKIVLSIMHKGVMLGLEEVLAQADRHRHSVQVCSPKCEFLFLSTKNFRDRFYCNSLQLKNVFDEVNEAYMKYRENLEQLRTRFRLTNDEVAQSAVVNSKTVSRKEDPPFQQRLLVRTAKQDTQSSRQKIKQIALQVSRRGPKAVPLPISIVPIFGGNVEGPETNNEAVTALTAVGEAGQAFARYAAKAQQTKRTSPVAKLERAIEDELEKPIPNVEKLVGVMKQRRVEQTSLLRTIQNKTFNKLKGLYSKSRSGKINEKELCARFTRTEDHPRLRTHDLNGTKQVVTIERITEQLAKDASKYSNRWLVERLEEQRTNLIAQSLTSDRRKQKELKVYGEMLQAFLEYVQEQGLEFVRRIGAPCFRGSLLLDLPQTASRETSRTGHSQGRGSIQLSLKKKSKPFIVRNSASFDHTLIRNKSTQSVPPQPKQQIAYEKQVSASRLSSLSVQSRKPRLVRSGKNLTPQVSIETLSDLDLMKVFYEWLQKHQKDEMRKNAMSSSGQQHFTREISERTRQTYLRLLNSSQDKKEQLEVVFTSDLDQHHRSKSRSLVHAKEFRSFTLTDKQQTCARVLSPSLSVPNLNAGKNSLIAANELRSLTRKLQLAQSKDALINYRSHNPVTSLPQSAAAARNRLLEEHQTLKLGCQERSRSSPWKKSQTIFQVGKRISDCIPEEATPVSPQTDQNFTLNTIGYQNIEICHGFTTANQRNSLDTLLQASQMSISADKEPSASFDAQNQKKVNIQVEDDTIEQNGDAGAARNLDSLGYAIQEGESEVGPPGQDNQQNALHILAHLSSVKDHHSTEKNADSDMSLQESQFQSQACFLQKQNLLETRSNQSVQHNISEGAPINIHLECHQCHTEEKAREVKQNESKTDIQEPAARRARAGRTLLLKKFDFKSQRSVASKTGLMNQNRTSCDKSGNQRRQESQGPVLYGFEPVHSASKFQLHLKHAKTQLQQIDKQSVGSQKFKTTRSSWISPLEQRKIEVRAARRDIHTTGNSFNHSVLQDMKMVSREDHYQFNSHFSGRHSMQIFSQLPSTASGSRFPAKVHFTRPEPTNRKKKIFTARQSSKDFKARLPFFDHQTLESPKFPNSVVKLQASGTQTQEQELRGGEDFERIKPKPVTGRGKNLRYQGDALTVSSQTHKPLPINPRFKSHRQSQVVTGGNFLQSNHVSPVMTPQGPFDKKLKSEKTLDQKGNQKVRHFQLNQMKGRRVDKNQRQRFTDRVIIMSLKKETAAKDVESARHTLFGQNQSPFKLKGQEKDISTRIRFGQPLAKIQQLQTQEWAKNAPTVLIPSVSKCSELDPNKFFQATSRNEEGENCLKKANSTEKQSYATDNYLPAKI